MFTCAYKVLNQWIAIPPLVIKMLVVGSCCVFVLFNEGINKFNKDMKAMVPSGIGLYWRFCVMVVAPIVLAVSPICNPPAAVFKHVVRE